MSDDEPKNDIEISDLWELLEMAVHTGAVSGLAVLARPADAHHVGWMAGLLNFGPGPTDTVH